MPADSSIETPLGFGGWVCGRVLGVDSRLFFLAVFFGALSSDGAATGFVSLGLDSALSLSISESAGAAAGASLGSASAIDWSAGGIAGTAEQGRQHDRQDQHNNHASADP